MLPSVAALVILVFLWPAAIVFGQNQNPNILPPKEPILTEAGRRVKTRYPDLANSECNRLGRMCLNEPSATPKGSNGNALIATIAANAVACFSKDALEDLTKFKMARDRNSFISYFDRRLCIPLPKEMDVLVTRSPGVFGSKTEFFYGGAKLWTYREGLKNYRLGSLE